MSKWSIPSNNGHQCIEFDAMWFEKDTDMIEHSICLYREFPDFDLGPSKLACDGDYIATLPQVGIKKAAGFQLVEYFDTWLKTMSPFSFHLSSCSSCEISLHVTEREGFIQRSDQPVFTACISLGESFYIEVAYVVDQSCIRIAKEGLAHVLRMVGTY